MQNNTRKILIFFILTAIPILILGCSNPVKADSLTTFNVNNAKQWNEAVNTIKTNGNGGSYVINIRNDFDLPSTETPTFGEVTNISVTIKGKHTISDSTPLSHNNKHYGGLLYIGSYQNVTIFDIALEGNRYHSKPVIHINGVDAVFTMRGIASISESADAGVSVEYGIFNLQENASITYTNIAVGISSNGFFYMSGGKISDNLHSGRRRAMTSVVMTVGHFFMSGGTISNNENHGTGGGIVSIFTGGKFEMSGGSIFGNITPPIGSIPIPSAVVTIIGGSFIMKGGIIYGNTESGVQEHLANTNTLFKHSISVAMYGDGSDILPHVEGFKGGTNHTIIGRK